MKIKTQDLIGPPLDWAVAKALGRVGSRVVPDPRPGTSAVDVDVYEGKVVVFAGITAGYVLYNPSTSGDTVIEIMEQEGISAMTASGHKGDRKWAAWQGDPPVLASEEITGPTLRVAVCRAFVASKLGDEVDVPEELMK